ncbi:hypothetical protein, partial [Escherichia coli]|uniref:hypothetical protein n=1 Tax=Escherichia coli TaxID=562 RepID=UPI003F523790
QKDKRGKPQEKPYVRCSEVGMTVGRLNRGWGQTATANRKPLTADILISAVDGCGLTPSAVKPPDCHP